MPHSHLQCCRKSTKKNSSKKKRCASCAPRNTSQRNRDTKARSIKKTSGRQRSRDRKHSHSKQKMRGSRRRNPSVNKTSRSKSQATRNLAWCGTMERSRSTESTKVGRRRNAQSYSATKHRSISRTKSYHAKKSRDTLRDEFGGRPSYKIRLQDNGGMWPMQVMGDYFRRELPEVKVDIADFGSSDFVVVPNDSTITRRNARNTLKLARFLSLAKNEEFKPENYWGRDVVRKNPELFRVNAYADL